jgi:pSer/pThr/pTyr-binding forkhead associated (FHA) protein
MTAEHKLIKIGRDPSNDVVLDDSSISRFHAEIFVDPEQHVFFSDLNSKFGSIVNGQAVREPVLLEGGDTLILGQGQKLDWEKLVFGKSSAITQTPKRSTPDSNGFWVKENRDLVIIFGLIIFLILVLSYIV